jgi:hypothetical protein
MPTSKPIRPPVVTTLALPRVEDDKTQRAFEDVVEAIRKLQGRVSSLETDVAAVAVAGSLLFDVVTPVLTVGFGAAFDNWDIGQPLGFTTLIQCVTDSGSRNVLGLVGGVDGKVVCIVNVKPGTDTVFFVDESATATASNRFTNIGAANINGGGVRGAVWYRYSGITTRWVNIGST